MKQLTKGFAALFLATVLFSPTAMLAEEVYSWVDENGVQHYGDMPPEKQQAETIQVEGMPVMSDDAVEYKVPEKEEGELSAAQQRREDLQRQRQENNAARAESKRMCDAALATVNRIEPHRRVYFTNEQGETERMDDEARVAQVAELRQFLSTNCN